MKSLLIALLVITTSQLMAQSDKYAAAMEKQLALFDSAKTTQDLLNLSNAFARIGDAEKTQWLPYYYAGLALSSVGWTDQSIDKDANADKITAFCDKAEVNATAPEDKSEIFALRNMAATQHMIVDPQSRWQTYGQEASQALEKGKQLNASNPRLYYLQGMSIFNTPEQFGGGKQKAKPVFEQAIELYKKEQPKSLHPKWGRQQAEDMLAQCK